MSPEAAYSASAWLEQRAGQESFPVVVAPASCADRSFCTLSTTGAPAAGPARQVDSALQALGASPLPQPTRSAVTATLAKVQSAFVRIIAPR